MDLRQQFEQIADDLAKMHARSRIRAEQMEIAALYHRVRAALDSLPEHNGQQAAQ